jgi:hypothetical protein
VARRGGFRHGYHPTPAVLHTLRVFDVQLRNYIDESGTVYGNKAVQEARQGYVTMEEARELKKRGWGDILDYKKRGEIPFSLHVLARQWEHKYTQAEGSAFESREFKRHIEQLISRTRDFVEDEIEYDELDDFIDDTFGLFFDEITFYAPKGGSR